MQARNNQQLEIHTNIVQSTYQKREYISKYNQRIFVHYVRFDNQHQGEYHSKYSDQRKFVAGQQATYTIETIEPPTGFQWNKVKPVQVEGTQAPHPKQPKQQQPRSEDKNRQLSIEIQSARRDAITFVCSLLEQNLVKQKDLSKLIKQYTKEFYRQSQQIKNELAAE